MKQVRKIRLLLLSLFVIMLLPMTANAAKVKLNKTSLNLTVGERYQLKLKNTEETIKWKSADKTIVSVTKKGKVAAKKVGKTKITAKVGEKKYVCKVTVKAKTSAKSGSGSSGNSSGKGGTVYWTPSGTVYHYSRSCSTLSRSRTVYSGTIAASGKPRACKVCG